MQLTDLDYAIEARRYTDMADAALKRREYALVARYTMLAQELARNGHACAMRAAQPSNSTMKAARRCFSFPMR